MHRLALRFLCERKDAHRAAIEEASLFGQYNAARRALKEHLAELLLKIRDLS